MVETTSREGLQSTPKWRAGSGSRKRSPAAVCAIALLMATVAPGCTTEKRGDEPQLVLFVLADMLRRDHVGSYGGIVPTPNIDSLAARGQRFTNALASFHQTTMSMGAIFTGLTPSIESEDPAKPLEWNGQSWCGMSRFQEDRPSAACIPAALPTLATAMRDAGYRTLGVVSNDLLFRPGGYDRGFDTWVEVGDENQQRLRIAAGEHPLVATSHLRAGAHVNEAVRRILPAIARGKIFLYVHYCDVHDLLIHDGYAGAVQAFDGALGGLLGQLRETGWLDHARIVFTADHGEIFREEHVVPTWGGRLAHFGSPSYRGVLEVPLIVVPPTRRDPTALIRGEDLLDLFAEISPFEPIRDRSRVLAGDELYLSELYFRTYQRGRWKLLRSRETDERALIDLVADPGETRDASAEHPEVLAELNARLETLGRQLASKRTTERGLSETDAARLRSLGYLEP